MSPTYPSAIEVFDLAENEDMLSPVEVDPEKLAHKYKEVRQKQLSFSRKIFLTCVQFYLYTVEQDINLS